MPRLAAGVLCAAASVLLLVCSAHLFAGREGGAAAAPLLVIGLCLALAAFKTLRPRRL